MTKSFKGLKPRVLLVGPWAPAQGGVTTFMLNVANSPLNARYAIVPFTTSRPFKPGLATIYGYRAMFRGGAWSFLVSAATTAWHVLKFPFALWRVELVQVQASDFQAFWEAALYVGICRLIGKPVLMRIGGSFDRFYESSSLRARAHIEFVLTWPDRVVVQAAFWADYIAERGRKTGVVVVPNWVADSLPNLGPREANAVPVCIFIAGPEAVQKGAGEVIAALKLLKLQGAIVRLRVIAASRELRARFIEEGAADICEFDGSLSTTEMIAAMRSADIFLLPSRGEGFPNSLLEAMACGLAAVVTPVGAVPEIVANDGAITVPVGNPEALAAAIATLARDIPLREKVALRGTRIVATHYVQSLVLPKLEAAWASLIGENA